MGYTQADLEKLRADILSGVQSVTYNGRSTLYATLEERRKLLADIERALNGGSTTRLAAHTKGFVP